MSGYAVSEILDVEGTLESGGEEATEWGDKGRENGHDEHMEVVGRIRNCCDVSPELRGTNSVVETVIKEDGDAPDQTGTP